MIVDLEIYCGRRHIETSSHIPFGVAMKKMKDQKSSHPAWCFVIKNNENKKVIKKC